MTVQKHAIILPVFLTLNGLALKSIEVWYFYCPLSSEVKTLKTKYCICVNELLVMKSFYPSTNLHILSCVNFQEV